MKPGAPPIIIAGKYQLLKQLGRGSMGTVWQAKHLTLQSLVAVKMMHPTIAFSSSGLQRFMLEARTAAEMRSPHVVQVLDHGVDGGTPYIVMELLEGESLAARLRRVRRLSPRQTAHFVTHVARALSRAERAGITHRDLKPDNVFLVQNEDEEVAKVLDFGVAKLEASGANEGEPTAAGALLGTPYYASPEQAEGLKTVDHRTDIWSLGVMTYECLVGRRPFEGSSLPALLMAICKAPPPVPSHHADVPAEFDDWFAKACAHRPADRFESARAAATELSRICGAGELTSADWTVRRAPEGRPFDLPRLQLSSDSDEGEEDEAPTEIWRGQTSESEAEDRAMAEASRALSLGSATISTVPPPRAPRPPEVEAALNAQLTATRMQRRAGSASRRSQLAALAGLAMLSAAGGFWLASRQPAALSAAALSAAVAAGRAPITTSATSHPATPKDSPLPVDSSEEVRTVDLNQLPTAPRPRAPAPRAKVLSSASPSESEPAPPGEDLPNPYR